MNFVCGGLLEFLDLLVKGSLELVIVVDFTWSDLTEVSVGTEARLQLLPLRLLLNLVRGNRAFLSFLR